MLDTISYKVELFESQLTQQDEKNVLQYMIGQFHSKRKLQEGRSVNFPTETPLGIYDELKIKGCGHAGGRVKFGVRHRTGPECPFFDFDGRYGIDFAKGHDRAFEGGMSFQQSLVEHRVANYLVGRNYDTVPSAGYGYVLEKSSGHRSWFTVLRWKSSFRRYGAFKKHYEVSRLVALRIGEELLNLGLKHHIFTYFSPILDGKEVKIIDFHASKLAHPLNDSFINRTMYFLFSLHIFNYWYKHHFQKNFGMDTRRFQSVLLNVTRALLPDVSVEEVDDFDIRIFPQSVINLRWPQDTQNQIPVEERIRALRSNRISSRALEMFCQPEEATIIANLY